MKVAVIGTGYVGLVSGAGFADFGHDVTCVDIDADRIARLQRGEIPLQEPGLPELVRRNIALGRLHFTTDVATAVRRATAAIIAVKTPSLPDGAADLSHVLDAARQAALAIEGETVFITKSTVPVGTAARLRALVAGATKQPFSIVSNPEFLKEGSAVGDFLRPARVIVGVDDDARALEVLRDLYRGVMRTGDRIQVMDTRSAELTKYAANAMLATRISFMNELAHLAEAVGADIEAVRAGIGSDPRIGPSFLFAGAGFGGSCLPKDLRALVHTARSLDVPLGIIDAAARANERQKHALVERLGRQLGRLEGKRIAIWGLAFKPETDDIRESPALALIDQLRRAGARVIAYDPAAMPNVRAQLGDAIELAPDAYAAATGADALVLVTEWHELRNPDFARLATTMRTAVAVDGRNVWSATEARAHGFAYCGVGRP